MISLTIIEAMLAGYRMAYYSDCPDVLFKIKSLSPADFDEEIIESYGILMIHNTEIHLLP